MAMFADGGLHLRAFTMDITMGRHPVQPRSGKKEHEQGRDMV
jgi:hypothetical protein